MPAIRKHTQPINGHTLSYTTVGDPSNPAVILIHGVSSFSAVWNTTLPVLVDDYYCITIDLLGHGESDAPHDGDYSIMAQAQRVLALADHLGLRCFRLIGHSMGGQVSLAIAAQLAPRRVTQLVIVSGVVSGQLTADGWRQHQLLRWFVDLPTWMIDLQRPLRVFDPYARYLVMPTWFHDFDSVPKTIWYEQSRWILHGIRARPYYHAGIAIGEGDFTRHLPRIQAPVHVIFGKQDGTVPVSEGRLLADLAPKATLTLVDKCGHFPMFEQPTAYSTFLQRVMLPEPVLATG